MLRRSLMRKDTSVSFLTQEGNFAKGEWTLSTKTGRGERIAQARRLLGVVLHQDMPQRAAAELMGKSGATWSRWESEDDRPAYENLVAFAQLCRAHGLPEITAAWLEFGEGEGPPQIGKPLSRVPTKPKSVQRERPVTVEDERAAQLRKRKNPRRA